MRPVTAPTLPERDDDLVVRAARGDRRALEELFRRYRDPAYRVAYRLLGNTEDALDAVQDGFIKALTHLRGFERPVLVQDVAVAGGEQRGPGSGPAAAAAGRTVRGRDRAMSRWTAA